MTSVETAGKRGTTEEGEEVQSGRSELRTGGSLMWFAGINENEVKTRVVCKAEMENKARTNGIFWLLITRQIPEVLNNELTAPPTPSRNVYVHLCLNCACT